MNEEVNIATNKKTSRWTSWVTWSAITCICIAANFLIPILFQFPGFSTWQSLPKSPSEAIRIVDADGVNVWIESKDGNVYTWALYCGFTENICNQWIKVDNVAEIKPFRYSFSETLRRGLSCKDLDSRSPNNPVLGKVNECVEGITHLDPAIPIVTYFAVLSNGTVKYWRDTGIGCWRPLACGFGPFIVVIIRILLVVTFVTSIIYLVKTVRQRHRAG